jgi:glyoxylase-like metal-dependent hydrolase (beta-lactamase superfamily II)
MPAVADERIVEGYTLGVFQSNTYVLAARAGNGAVVIDPGQDASDLIGERLAAHGLTLEAVLLTHGHIDHIWDAARVADGAGVPAYIHPADLYMLNEPGAALGRMGLGKFDVGVPSDVRHLSDGDELHLGGVNLTVRHTPGHTPGHCVFVTDGILFSGDLIFQGSVGRTDFPGGSMDDEMDSIRRVVLPMEDDIVILSGHGPETTVGTERRSNPFVIADARGELPRLLGL